MQTHWISDLSRCRPREAISRDGRPGAWMAVDYEVEEGTGVMIYGTPSRHPPPVILPLGASGPHAIHVGVHYGAGAGATADRILQLKLTSDAAFSRIANEECQRKDGRYPEKILRSDHISETFWKAADLTGQDLMIAGPPAASGKESNLAFVRLTRLEAAALEEFQKEKPHAETKRLIANYDGGSLTQWDVVTPEDFLAEFECLRDSDFDIALYAMAYGPITFHPSKVGDMAEPEAAYGIGRVVQRCLERGVDPLKQAIRAAHACGVRLFPQCRFEGPQLPPQHIRAHHGGRWFAEHPEWLARYPDGQPTRHLSFAFPQVRDFYVRLCREWVEDYRADGVNLLFSRSYPFAYYEQPVCDRFREQYGEDMRSVPQEDRRTWEVRAFFVTQFLREVRSMLDETGRTQGRHIPCCYLVPHGNPQHGFPGEQASHPLDEPLHAALDVAAWIREGLVDDLLLHLHIYGEHDGSPFRETIAEYARLARGTRTKIFADIYPRRQPPRQYRKIAMTYYGAGADGLAFWDSYNRHARASEWAFVRRLGHREELAGWEGKGDDYFRQIPLLSLDGFPFGEGRHFALPTDG